jgi:hypothetical protein
MRSHPRTTVGLSVFFILAWCPVAAVAIRYIREADFNKVEVGDSYGTVLQKMGNPSKIDVQGEAFPPYTSHPCSSPCVKRLWYENRLMLDLEAWSVSIDSSGKVVDKYQWMSP